MKPKVSVLARRAMILCLALSMLIPHLCSCFAITKYLGDHTDLYTVAVNNVFAIDGYMSNGEVIYDPVIEVIETDEYGRVLFFYDEYYDDSIQPSIGYGMAFVIMQKSEDGYVYFYQDDCYVPYFDVVDEFDEVMKRVDPEVLEALKARNDWDLEPDESKYTKAQISNKKPEGKLRVRDYEFDEVVYPYAKANGYEGSDTSISRSSEYCNSDLYGRELYYVFGMSSEDDGQGGTVYARYVYAVIVSPGKKFSDDPIVEITDPTESYEKIRWLKRQNNWNQPEAEEESLPVAILCESPRRSITKEKDVGRRPFLLTVCASAHPNYLIFTSLDLLAITISFMS